MLKRWQMNLLRWRERYEGWMMSKTCGNCVMLIEEEGEPYYCAILPLYTVRDREDLACDGWVGKKNEKEKEKAKRTM